LENSIQNLFEVSIEFNTIVSTISYYIPFSHNKIDKNIINISDIKNKKATISKQNYNIN